MKEKTLKIILEYLVMTAGCLVFAIAWEGFVIPNNMSSGGLMGLCTVIQYATDNMLPASALYIAFNVVLLIFAFFAMGLSFGVRTIYCIVLTSILMPVVAGMPSLHSVAGNFLALPDPVLVPVVAGLLEGLGLGLVFKHDGSTGGMDIVAIFVNRHWPISTGRFFLFADFIIITSILFLPGRAFGDMVYGYIMMVVSALVLDMVTLGSKSSMQLLVFSQHYETIADRIINELDRGVTVLKAQGWYTKQDKNVLLIMVRKKQLLEVTKLIKLTDPKAFVSVSAASSVYGEGFEEIKVGLTKTKKNDKKEG